MVIVKKLRYCYGYLLRKASFPLWKYRILASR